MEGDEYCVIYRSEWTGWGGYVPASDRVLDWLDATVLKRALRDVYPYSLAITHQLVEKRKRS